MFISEMTEMAEWVRLAVFCALFHSPTSDGQRLKRSPENGSKLSENHAAKIYTDVSAYIDTTAAVFNTAIFNTAAVPAARLLAVQSLCILGYPGVIPLATSTPWTIS